MNFRMTHTYDLTKDQKLKLRPKFDVGDIFKFIGCKMSS